MTTLTNPDGTPWEPPTAEELLARGDVAVKREFLRPPPSAPALAPAPADEAGVRGDGGSDKNRTGKSRKQLARERQAARDAGAFVCNAYIKGECTYGDKCRYGHDINAYILSKQPDLPGSCPFVTARGECPHGVTCRFYGAHPPPVPEAAAKCPRVSPEALAALDEKRTPEDARTLPLPLPKDDIPEERNALSSELKQDLRKGKVRFRRADALLEELGVKSSWRYVDDKKNQSKPERSNEDETERAGDEGVQDARGEADEGGGKRPRTAPEDDADDGAAGTELPLRPEEKRTIDFRDKLYLAPLTTVGNLPFRRVCKGYGVDVTCGEMAMCTNLLQGQPAEWALLRRHRSEDIFGAQICGGYSDSVSRCAQLLDDTLASRGGLDFVDINMGCPIDLVCNKGAGSMLLQKPDRMEQIVRASAPLLSCPLTLKTRMGYYDSKRVAHELIPKMRGWGAAAVTLHGRTRQQRYSKLADWDYIKSCAAADPDLPLVGNGDVFNYRDYVANVENTGVTTCMVARGALIKPWIFTEIKERRDWDISAGERLDALKDFCAFGLEHWGADARGVASTRKFLLEWLSFTHRYVPVGLLDVCPAGIHQRPPEYVGRSDLETLLGSSDPKDWVKISAMLLGPPPENFSFKPKHKSNAYGGGGERDAAKADWGDTKG